MRGLILLPLLIAGVLAPRAASSAEIACSKGDLEGLQAFRIPPDTYLRDKSAEVTLTIDVGNDGAYERVHVSASSRLREIDRAAIESIKKTRLTGSCLRASSGPLHVHYNVSLTPNGVGPDGITRLWRTTSE
ncbi:TonB family protein [Pseudoxanthomonas sp. PXM01]|uniref:energy transducer TonB family protein n=1 Tax=Pseudoxanthomonas sp. PXM01 TaxID=2769295 RepID=UPI00177F1420|nr:TonB family protein [Pseudoxanthomonas sp. PXM01]MBD9468644.1 TonB family protein [Pseudoxanthomonas sp. PXM01]